MGLDAQMIAEADLLDRKVMLQKRHLFRQRDLLPVFRFERKTEQAAQMLNHSTRELRITLHLRGDRIQSVEEKVRIQLHPQRVETSLGKAFLEPLQAQLARKIVTVIPVCL